MAGISIQKKSMSINHIKDSLNELSSGLLYYSESEYPLELLDPGKQSPEQTRSYILSLHPDVQHIEQVSTADFFQKLLRNIDVGGNNDMKAMGLRYKKLQVFIDKTFFSSTVFRCGKIKVGIYIVMQTNEGHTLILKTVSIET